MTSHTTAKILLGRKLSTLLALLFSVLIPAQALSNDPAQDHAPTDEQQKARVYGHVRIPWGRTTKGPWTVIRLGKILALAYQTILFL